MSKIRIPIIVQDPEIWLASASGKIKLPPAESAEFADLSFMDGPCSTRVVTEDAEKAGYIQGEKIIDGFRGPSGKDILQEAKAVFASGNPQKISELIYSGEFIQVSAFACVLRTMSLFERKNILGRSITWAFSPNPLICQPRRKMDYIDARYQRDTHKIFFSQTSRQPGGGQPFYTSLSREAVAHETAHAIVDGINPHLFSSGNPHAIALHESLADLTALLVAIKSEALMKYVMAQSGGSLDGENAFSRFAENIGKVISGGKVDALRSFLNQDKLTGETKYPYGAGMVLSGAIWDVIRLLHAPYRNKLAETTYKDKPNPQYSASGKPLADLTRRLRTLLYRALDFLPGGDITLGDYGRALLLVDHIQFGPNTEIARNLRQALINRGIFQVESAAEVDLSPAKVPPTPPGGWVTLLRDENAARLFIQNRRQWLGIPDALNFDQVRIEIQPAIRAPQSPNEFIEVVSFRSEPIGLLRVMWPTAVDNVPGGPFSQIAGQRARTVGTTIVVDPVANHLLARLSNASPTTELYPDPKLRAERQGEIDNDNHSIGLYLDSCHLLKAESNQSEVGLAAHTGVVKEGLLFLSGQGVSLNQEEAATIVIK